MTTQIPLPDASRASPVIMNMSLNWAQLLVHDDESLARFRADHRIPNNLTFMQVSVNFVWIVLTVDTLMQRERQEFTVEDLFHVYCVVRYRKNPETHMFEGSHYLHIWKPNQPQMRLVTDYLDKDLYLNDFIWGHPIIPPLRIPEQAPKPRSSLSDEVSDLFEGTLAKFRRLVKEVEGESSSSCELSSSNWDVDLGDEGGDDKAEVEDGEEVHPVYHIFRIYSN
ncbi:hypothetical protein Acr_26g0003850 [Actinidia rufa]|uniref:Uncharacterized protein n=1 Tax=Actinidia rufa TaxID=165716 RepID=A0A7J0H276_9ERIC|nr:hypothetical protein Acr_26g0003850 [Actinidia rufa]